MKNKACTFFGHRTVTKEIEPTLRSTLTELIEKQDVKLFYVGNHGQFDGMVLRMLHELSLSYTIDYYVVLAYYSGKRNSSGQIDYSNTIFPCGIEAVPKRFAISYRNKWMLERSDYVITYVDHDLGSGAAQFKKMAEKKGREVIDLR